MNAFKHFGGWMAIAITLVSGFGIAAEAQVSQQNTESAPIEASQTVSDTVPASEPATLTSQEAVTFPESSPSPDSSNIPVRPSISQVELPFSDVSPDHWAYEALLFLSTGNRQ